MIHVVLKSGGHVAQRAFVSAYCYTHNYVLITQIGTHVCVCVLKKKQKTLALPCEKTEYWKRRRRGKRLLFVRVSLLIDASHKTSTIRNHFSSFLPLLLSSPRTRILFTLSPAATPSFIHFPSPSPRFLSVGGATLVSLLPRVPLASTR